MKFNRYTILLYLFKGLIYSKRGIVFVLRLLWKGLLRFNNLYKRTLGFRLYKIGVQFKRKLKKISFIRHHSKFEILGQRTVLQILALMILVVVMIPHSKLYTKDSTTIPGHDTLLYKLVGPGDQDFSFDETMLETTDSVADVETWKSGAVVARLDTGDEKKEPQELVGTASGGSAVTKPIIMSGADIGNVEKGTASNSKNRSDIVYYKVQPGDVIGKIAQRYGVSVETILWANNLTTRSYIRPGDSLKILPSSGLTHKVVAGDTLIKIAKKYDADKDEIIKINKLQADGSDLVVGEELIIPGGVKPKTVRQIVRTTYRPKSFSNVVAPPPSLSTPAGSGYLWPTAATIITQYYSWRHNGLDIASKIGTPVYATKAGVVKVAQCGWNGGYGCYIKIDHGGGVESRYGHNSKLLVKVGDYVTQGQTISLMGSTGHSTGPHVHFEIRVNGKNVNPLSYVRR